MDHELTEEEVNVVSQLRRLAQLAQDESLIDQCVYYRSGATPLLIRIGSVSTLLTISFYRVMGTELQSVLVRLGRGSGLQADIKMMLLQCLPSHLGEDPIELADRIANHDLFKCWVQKCSKTNMCTPEGASSP